MTTFKEYASAIVTILLAVVLVVAFWALLIALTAKP